MWDGKEVERGILGIRGGFRGLYYYFTLCYVVLELRMAFA